MKIEGNSFQLQKKEIRQHCTVNVVVRMCYINLCALYFVGFAAFKGMYSFSKVNLRKYTLLEVVVLIPQERLEICLV